MQTQRRVSKVSLALWLAIVLSAVYCFWSVSLLYGEGASVDNGEVFVDPMSLLIEKAASGDRAAIAQLDKQESLAVRRESYGPVADNSVGGFGGVVYTPPQYPKNWVNGAPSWFAGTGVKNYWVGFYDDDTYFANTRIDAYKPKPLKLASKSLWLTALTGRRVREDGYTGPGGAAFTKSFTGRCVNAADRFTLVDGASQTFYLWMASGVVNQFYHWDVSIPKIDLSELRYSPTWDCSYFLEATGINRFLSHFHLDDAGINWLYPSVLSGSSEGLRYELTSGRWYINIEIGYEGTHKLFIMMWVHDGDSPHTSHGEYQVQGFYLSAYYNLGVF
jgi:hypothetical protein